MLFFPLFLFCRLKPIFCSSHQLHQFYCFSIQIYYYGIKYIFKKILCRQLTIYQDTESYTINGTLSDTISDITDLILSFSA